MSSVYFQATGIQPDLIMAYFSHNSKCLVLESVGESVDFGKKLVSECKQALSAVLPFTDKELKFLDLLLDKGEIDATTLTSNKILQTRIQQQPLLQWKALNVRQHKG